MSATQPVSVQPDSLGTVSQLRARIAKIEGHAPGFDAGTHAEAWTSGLAELDAALGGGINFGALHEITAASPVDLPVASAFAFGLLARLKRRGPILWCMSGLTRNEHGAPYGPGLAAFGIDPARIISVNVRAPRDLSFVLEEAARLVSLAAIIAEGPQPSFTASRRMALLLATSHVPMLFLPEAKTGGKSAEGSAATTRFVVSPAIAPENPVDPYCPGSPAFHVTLARHRGGRPGLSFQTVFDHAKLCFAPLSRAASDSVSDRQFSVGDPPAWQQRA